MSLSEFFEEIEAKGIGEFLEWLTMTNVMICLPPIQVSSGFREFIVSQIRDGVTGVIGKTVTQEELVSAMGTETKEMVAFYEFRRNVLSGFADLIFQFLSMLDFLVNAVSEIVDRNIEVHPDIAKYLAFSDSQDIKGVTHSKMSEILANIQDILTEVKHSIQMSDGIDHPSLHEHLTCYRDFFQRVIFCVDGINLDVIVKKVGMLLKGDESQEEVSRLYNILVKIPPALTQALLYLQFNKLCEIIVNQLGFNCATLNDIEDYLEAMSCPKGKRACGTCHNTTRCGSDTHVSIMYRELIGMGSNCHYLHDSTECNEECGPDCNHGNCNHNDTESSVPCTFACYKTRCGIPEPESDDDATYDDA